MNNITTHTVCVPTPDGGEADIEVTIHWEHDMNPADRDPCHYRGEEDGWTATDIELGHTKAPSPVQPRGCCGAKAGRMSCIAMLGHLGMHFDGTTYWKEAVLGHELSTVDAEAPAAHLFETHEFNIGGELDQDARVRRTQEQIVKDHVALLEGKVAQHKRKERMLTPMEHQDAVREGLL